MEIFSWRGGGEVKISFDGGGSVMMVIQWGSGGGSNFHVYFIFDIFIQL